MIVEVTQADIDAGTKQSCYSCPIALAISRKTNLPVKVGGWTCKIGITNHVLSWEAVSFIGKFDTGRPVEPFSFEL